MTDEIETLKAQLHDVSLMYQTECHERLMRDKHIRDINTERITVVEANRKLRDLAKQMYAALDYASDLTKPEGLSGCDCPICEAMMAYERSELV